MELKQAKQIAVSLIDYLSPYCERIDIAGSVRRRKQEPKDIELVAIPKVIPEPIGMFTGVDFPDEPAPMMSAITLDVVQRLGRIKKGVNGDGKYFQVLLPEGVYLDLFVVTPPAQFGVIYTIRTGPGDFSQWLVTPKRSGGAMPSHLHVKDGALWSGDELIETPTEPDFFEAIGLDWIKPNERAAKWSVR